MHASIGTFGKLRGQGDFLQAGNSGPLAQELRQWVEAGLGRAVSRAGFTEAYDTRAPFAFVHRSRKPSPTSLLGVMLPSQDAVGRRFPLLAYAEIDTEPLHAFPHLVPLVYGSFFERLKQLLGEAWSHGSSAQYLAELGTLREPNVGVDILGEAQRYTRWTQDCALEDALAWIYESVSGQELAQVLGLIRSASAAFRGQQAAPTPVALRVPLGASGAGGAALWLDLVRRIAEWSQMVPSCFWSVQPDSSELLVQLGVTPPATFGELWLRRADSDHICDLTIPSAIRSTEPFALEALQNPGCPVFELLCSL